MKVIFDKRRTGKTSKLIELAAKSHGYIVCLNHDMAYHISSQAQEMKLDIHFPITLREFLNQRYQGGNIKSFLFDEAGMMLQSLTTVPIEAITISDEDFNTRY